MSKKNILKTTLLSCMLLSTPFAITGCNEDDDLKITLTAGNISEVSPGGIIQLKSEISDSEYGLPTYTIVEGNDYATVSLSGVLTVANNAPNNTIIKVKASIGGVESNVISFKVVVVEATAISISAPNNTNLQLERNQEVSIVTTITPTNATNTNATYSITSGSEHATISNTGVLKVKSAAPVNAQIKVKATLGTLTSNELTFTVIETPESAYDITFVEEDKVLDSTTNQASYTIQPILWDNDDNIVSNPTFSYEIFNGSEYVNLNQTTGVVTPKGHGEAVIKVTALGTNSFAYYTITSIVPPKTIELENEYNSKNRYGFAQSEAMSFEVSGVGASAGQVVSDTYKYEFFLDDATTADATVASYNKETKKITFATKAIGHKVKIVVTSDTGATKETSKTFVVDVNNGVNVRNMSELILAQNQGANKTINLIGDCIVTNADVVSANTLSKFFLRYSGNLTFYGNGHKIDFSDVAINYKQVGGDDTFFYVDNSAATTDNVVKIYNLDLIGNTGIDAAYGTGENEGKGPWYGGFERGLRIKGADDESVKAYLANPTGVAKPGHTDLEIDDIKVSKFKIGLRVEYAIDSEISNIVLENNHQGGAEITSSELTFTNIRLGKNGTTGIELTPDYNRSSGLNFNAPQNVKFKGYIDCSNSNDFATPYMAHDQKLSLLAQVLNGLGTGLSDAKKQAFFDTTGDTNSINWALLIFNNFESPDPNEQENKTVVTFEGVVGGTYKDINQIADNELGNYKFLAMDVIIDASILGGNPGDQLNLGKIVVLNQSYNPSSN